MKPNSRKDAFGVVGDATTRTPQGYQLNVGTGKVVEELRELLPSKRIQLCVPLRDGDLVPNDFLLSPDGIDLIPQPYYTGAMGALPEVEINPKDEFWVDPDKLGD